MAGEELIPPPVVKQSRKLDPVAVLIGGGIASNEVKADVERELSAIIGTGFLTRVVTIRDYTSDYWARNFSRAQRPLLTFETVDPNYVPAAVERAMDYLERVGTATKQLVISYGNIRGDQLVAEAIARGIPYVEIEVS